MFIDFTPEQHAFRAEIRALISELMTSELVAEVQETDGGGPHYFAAMEKLGEAGWLGVGWKKEHGGQGRSPIEEFLFFDEMHRIGFPIPLLTLCTVGPTLAAQGTDEQRAQFLPRILAGTLHFSIGYTEPEAGTDLAGLATRAESDGDDYIITGQKIFISLADFADYLWLAVRTDPDAPKHKGLTIIMVPMDAEGVSTTPIQNLGDSNLHAVYLDKVRVPKTMRVGPENGGWRMITSQLNHERIALMMVGPLARLLDEVRDYARENGTISQPWVQRNLAEVDARLEVLKLLNWKQAWNLGEGRLDYHEASGLKVYGSELYVSAYRQLMEVVGPASILQRGTRGAVLSGDLERHYRATLVLTFGGGVNEIQRDIIAAAGLRMPRSKR
ncbi:MAG: acyl-CoA dehydrogenase [Proteobacteria bacterium]|nr:acyl-CoA dehydrogenase [Pseudomonadota bacterium]MCP4922135.1 acyl-CoA dehydrogenase [Pseudomonadota bacterium]